MLGVRLLFIWLGLEAGMLDIAHHALNFWRLGLPRKDSTAADGLNSVFPWLAGYPVDRPFKYVYICRENMWDRFGLRELVSWGAYLLLIWPALTMRRFLRPGWSGVLGIASIRTSASGG